MRRLNFLIVYPFFLLALLGGFSLQAQSDLGIRVVKMTLNQDGNGVDAELRISKAGKPLLEEVRVTQAELSITTDTARVEGSHIDEMILLAVPTYIIPDNDSAANYRVQFDFQEEKQEKGFYGTLLNFNFYLDLSSLGKASLSTQEALGSVIIPQGVSVDWLDALVAGASVLALLLLLFSELVPIIDRLRFRANYVKTYHLVATPGRTQVDPLTKETFHRNEKVVVKCNHMTSLTTWEENNYQCLSYPNDCQEGIGGAGEVAFFSMRDGYRNLNWLWFGSLGGFVGWIIQMILVSIIPETSFTAAIPGIGLGFGLSFSLAWVEERGQSRDFDWGRVLIRALVGTLVGGFIFWLGGIIQTHFLAEAHGYLQGLLSFILFGLALGWVLSIRSTISWSKGLVGGVIASLVGFSLYYLILQAGLIGLAQVLSYITLGAILGIGLASYVSRLEDFELEYVSPPEFRRTVPISKWLKANQEIVIGSDPACDVFVKWTDDEVEPQHAVLSLRGGQVYLEAWAETLIQGRRMPLRQEIRLKKGDIIQLGSESISRMQFLAK